jgi:hypothetical protein
VQRSKKSKTVSETSDPPLESLLDMRIFDKYDSQKERKVSKKAGALYAVCVCVWEGCVCVCLREEECACGESEFG